MKAFKILVMLATIGGGVALSSCGTATCEERPPALRPLPGFVPVPTPTPTPTPTADYAK